ncbi:hypothetical protein ACFIOY_07775 [Bradyrhizobium sp. TZ2]
MISVEACTGDESATAAIATSCKNLKADFTDDYSAAATATNLSAVP